MANLAIIPARGGSKRIEKKNIKLFFGKPVISHVIETTLSSKLFSEVMISTDDAEIAKLAVNAGAVVPFMRSAKNADDYATLADVLLEVISNYKAVGKEFETVCCLLPTAALITGQRLQEGLMQLQKTNCSSVISVLKFGYPIQRALKEENGFVVMREPKYIKTRSQDLETHYHDSGQFYWIKTEDFLKEKQVFMQQSSYIQLEENEAQDVDTMEDWELLTLKYAYKNKLIKI